MKGRHLVAIGLWTIAWFLFLLPLLLQTHHIPASDFSGQFYAFGSFQAREMLAGRLPLWSPGSYAGVPFAADTQAAVFYLPRWLTILLSAPWGFSYYALQLEALAHIWLAGVFTYFLAYDITRRTPAGLLAAFAFGLGGYLLSYPVQQLAILETIAWLPLVLFLLRRAILPAPPRFGLLMAAGAVLGFSLYAGHPQTFLHAAYLAAAYFLFLAWQAQWSWRWVAGLGVVTAAIALGVSAAAWAPALQYTLETTRTAAGYEFVSSGFPMLDYLQTIVPGSLTLWSPQYVGLVAVLFALLAWFGRGFELVEARRPGFTTAEIVFWGVVVLVAALLSLGDKGILFEAAYRLAPGFSLFRQQERLVSLFSLGLALLAAKGFALALKLAAGNLPALRKLARQSLLVVIVLWLVAGVLLAGTRQPADVWLAIWLGQAVLLIILALGLWLLVGGRTQLSVSLILGVLIVDLLLAVRPTMQLQPGSPSVFWPEPAWLEILRQDSPRRIDSQNLFSANIGELHGLEDIRGISPLKATVVEQYETLPRPVRWQLLGVTHVIASEAIEPELQLLAPVTEGLIPGQPIDAWLFRFPEALPPAWLSAEPVLVADETAALSTLSDPAFDPARQVILTAPNGAAVAQVRQEAAAAASLNIESGQRGLRLTVDAPGDMIVVISEWLRPGWRAMLEDGRTLPLLNANAGLMALVVPAGQHVVTLRYQPTLVWLALAASLVAAALVVVMARRWQPQLSYRPVPARTNAAPVPRPVSPSLARRRQARWALLVIILAGFGLRVLMLDHQELRGDEAFSFLFTRLPVEQVVPELIDQGDPHPPLHYLGLNLWSAAAGFSEFALRYLSVLAGTLLLPILFILGRRMLGRSAGLLAATLAALSPGLIWLSQDVRNQYALVLLFASLATLIPVSMPLPERRSRRASMLWWSAYMAAGTLTVYSHYYGVFALMAHGLYLAYAPGRRSDLGRWTVGGILVFLALLPWLAPAFGRTVAAGQLSDPSQPELAGHLVLVGRDLIAGQSLPAAAARWLFVGMLIVALGAAVPLSRRRPGWAAMLVGWLVGGMLAIFLVRFSRGTFNAFYGSVVAPAWWLLVAAGLIFLWRDSRWRRTIAVAGTTILLGGMVVSLAGYYTNPAYSRTIGYRSVAAYLADQAGPEDVFVQHFPDPVWDYYLRDISLQRSLQPAELGTPPAETESALAALADRHPRLWFVPYVNSVWDPENVAGRWLDYHTLTESRDRLDRHTLLAYRPLAQSSAVMTPVGREAGEAVRLIAAYATADGQPVDLGGTPAIRPGSELAVTLLWEALQPVERDGAVFVHLLNADGFLAAQHDGIPAQGTRPTTTWQPGERILDTHAFTVPAGYSGDGRLIAGLYDPTSLERWLFDDGVDAVVLVDPLQATTE